MVPFAFSVHQIVSSVGADVGFAAIVGLAILVLLYFSQARETANLRQQAYEAAQRVEQLEARVAQVARRQPVPAPAPAPQGAAANAIGASRIVRPPATVGAPARAAVPAAPAGVGAPALAAATRLIPVAVPAAAHGASTAPPSHPGPAVEPDRAVDQLLAPQAADQVPAPAADQVPAAAADQVPAPAAAASRAQVPYAAPIQNLASTPAVVPAATFAGTGNGAPRADTGVARGFGGRARPQVRPIPPPSHRRPPVAAAEPVRRSRLRLVAALLVGAAVAAAAVFAVLQLTALGSSSSTGAAARTSTAATHGNKHGSAINPSKVTVAVLNGTSTLQLATRTAQRLATLGFRQGTIGDAAQQTYTSSVVAYMPGHRSDALAVAHSLKLKPSDVQPVDSTTQAVACPSTPCSATVVVTAGADLASR
jgi:hypothetical protein